MRKRELFSINSNTLLIISSLLIIVLFHGCVTVEQKKANLLKIMESWLGSHQSELIAQWGPPTRTESDGKGGKILIYESWRDTGSSPGYIYGGPFATYYVPPKNHGYKRTRMFYVDEKGIIYYGKFKGL